MMLCPELCGNILGVTQLGVSGWLAAYGIQGRNQSHNGFWTIKLSRC